MKTNKKAFIVFIHGMYVYDEGYLYSFPDDFISFILCFVCWLFNLNCFRFFSCSVFWRINTLYCACSRVITSATINVIFGFYHVFTLREIVEIIICRAILWSTVVAPVISTKLVDRLHARSTFVYHLNEIIITVGCDGKTNFHLVAHLKIALSDDLPF